MLRRRVLPQYMTKRRGLNVSTYHIAFSPHFRFILISCLGIHWDSDQWVSYDDAETLVQKREFANSRCLGGLMVWALDQVDQNAKSVLYPNEYVNWFFSPHQSPSQMCFAKSSSLQQLPQPLCTGMCTSDERKLIRKS